MPAPDLSRPEPDQFLDGDMRPADIIEALEVLSFRRAPLAARTAVPAAEYRPRGAGLSRQRLAAHLSIGDICTPDAQAESGRFVRLALIPKGFLETGR
jgi:hypothetical protein